MIRLVDAKSNDDSWHTKKLVYTKARLIDIANGLTIYYGKEFIISDQNLERCKYSFTFDNKTIKEAGEILAEGAGFTIDERSDYLVLEGGSCPTKER